MQSLQPDNGPAATGVTAGAALLRCDLVTRRYPLFGYADHDLHLGADAAHAGAEAAGAGDGSVGSHVEFPVTEAHPTLTTIEAADTRWRWV